MITTTTRKRNHACEIINKSVENIKVSKCLFSLFVLSRVQNDSRLVLIGGGQKIQRPENKIQDFDKTDGRAIKVWYFFSDRSIFLGNGRGTDKKRTRTDKIPAPNTAKILRKYNAWNGS
jgi:hypothetical protein